MDDTNMGFGYLSDEIDAYSDHASGLSEGTHYIHDNRLFIWRDGAKGLEQRIAELEESIGKWRDLAMFPNNEVEVRKNLEAENARLKDQLQEQAKILDYYRSKDD